MEFYIFVLLSHRVRVKKPQAAALRPAGGCTATPSVEHESGSCLSARNSPAPTISHITEFMCFLCRSLLISSETCPLRTCYDSCVVLG